MQSARLAWNESGGWTPRKHDPASADLILYFGTRQVLADGARYDELRRMYPGAHVLGCSTGGQIRDDDVTDNEIAAAAIAFESTSLRVACETIRGAALSRACGEAIGDKLLDNDLAGIFVLSDGLHVNGSELVAGITSVVGPGIPLTGGLAGDGPQFERTLVGADCPPRSQTVGAVGFYGGAVRIGHGSAGGWDEFGPRRRITRSQGNILYELDGKPALDLYVRYLGEEDAKGLPGTALLFPLLIRDPERPAHDIVRTVLAVDRTAGSMTFAGDVPEGWTAQLMRGSFDRLAAGAAKAAKQAAYGVQDARGDHLAVLVSCIGRRLLMGQQTIEEIEAASAELGADVPRIGFYSYGEISPHAASGMCELHNQTMTVTAIAEAAG